MKHHLTSLKTSSADGPSALDDQQGAPEQPTRKSTRDAESSAHDGVEDRRSQLLGDCGMDVEIEGDVRVVGTNSSPRREPYSSTPVSGPGSPASSSASRSTCISVSLLEEIEDAIQEGNRAMSAELGNNSDN